MPDPLAGHFAAFARTTRRRAPLYSRLSEAMAGSPLVEELFADAPEEARVPVTLFAAVQYLLLGEPGTPLARYYPNLTPEPVEGDPAPAFLAFCRERSASLRRLVATRLPQTNEVGRSSLLVAGLGQLGARPVSLLDLGASAGLNLLLDRYSYSDGAGHALGDGPLALECAVSGSRPGARTPHGVADRIPAVEARLGLDARPVDLGDDDAVRWLEACVWPDQADRFARLHAAVELCRADPPEVRRGDAVDDLASAVGALSGEALPVVTTTWVLSYLPPARQSEFVEELARLGASRDLAWVWAEAPNQVGVLPIPGDLATTPLTVLGLTAWRDGVRTDRALATCHQHGYWLGWR